MLKSAVKKLIRDAAFHNYSTAKSAAVLFDASKQQELSAVRKYIKELENKGLKVDALGYENAKEISDFNQAHANIIYISNKELNWYLKPNSEDALAFMEKPFDILIDLSTETEFSIQYLVALSKAQFKVGCVKTAKNPKEKEINYYDFMLQLNERKELSFLLKQLEHYLGLIKK